MIYLFHGSDVDKVRTKAFAWVAAARAKDPNIAYARLGKEEVTLSALEDAAHSGGLFTKRLLIVLDDPFGKAAKESGDETESKADVSLLEENMPMLAESDNAIVIIAPKLSAARLKKIESKAAKVYAFDAAAKEKRGFNMALVNALSARDGKKLWLEIVRALNLGDAPEMVHGLLHWKARDLMSKGSRIWSDREAQNLSLSLIRLVGDSRHEGIELPEALEKFALSL